MTPSITTAADLKLMITRLESQKDMQELELKQTVRDTLEGLKPANLVKTAFNKVATSPHIQENIVDSTLGMAAGFLSKKILVGRSKNPIKKFLGSVAQYGVTNVVTNHPSGIKNMALKLFQSILAKRRKSMAED